MKTSEFKEYLRAAPEHELRFVLPDGGFIPAHAHVTEIGRVEKKFMDCGGAIRTASNCTLQIWVADGDEEHRFAPGKLVKVFEMASELFNGDDLDVEIEYEDFGCISQHPVLQAEAAEGALTFRLGSKHTDCLAKEACGLTPSSENAGGCCGGNC